jgi:hypothetical protein
MNNFSLPYSISCPLFFFLLLKLVDSITGMDPRLVEAALNGNTIELQKLLQEDSLLLPLQKKKKRLFEPLL